MLLAEYDYDTDIAVQRAEEREIAFAEGVEQGIERGFGDGVRQTKQDTAVVLKNMGLSFGQIIQATGLSEEEIEKL